MKQNLMALLIGLIGAAVTLFAYSQTFVSPSLCITLGLIVLMHVGLACRRRSDIFLISSCFSFPFQYFLHLCICLVYVQ
ncbi:hypothetical protein HKD37_19G052632 [Glycine soja]